MPTLASPHPENQTFCPLLGEHITIHTVQYFRILSWILLAVVCTAGAAAAAVVEFTRTQELCGGC